MSKFFRRFYGVEPTEVNRYCRQEANLLVNRHIKDIFSDLNNNIDLGLHCIPPAQGAGAAVLPGINNIRYAPAQAQPVEQLNAPVPLHCNRNSCPGHPQIDSQTPPTQNAKTRRARSERVRVSSTPDDDPGPVQDDKGDYLSSNENILNT